MLKSDINIEVTLDDQKMPEHINWRASQSTADSAQEAKAFFLSLWDGADKSALRIDLWTKTMMVDEMGDFFFQTISAMADTLRRSTGYEDLSADMKKFANDFYKKFREKQMKENKLS